MAYRNDHIRRFVLGLACVPLAAPVCTLPGLALQPIIYPAKGQSQQNKDKGECDAWAQQQTGVNPVQIAQQQANQPAPSGPQGERAKGAARGAVGGTVIGAITGNAGKGAAIGAVVGTMGGGAKQRRRAEQQQKQAEQSRQQSEQAMAAYSRAFGACMEGRGYVIK
jgi:hypothetical protein